jgi:hypothetical protein
MEKRDERHHNRETISKLDGMMGSRKMKSKQYHTAQRHMSTITHLVLDLLHRFELFDGKQQTCRRNEIDERYIL